jgi:hypothetical protein
MTTLLKFLIVSLVSITLVQCGDFTQNSVDGVGDVIQFETPIKAHTSLHVERGWKVVLIPSEENKIFIEANENLINDELILEETNKGLIISAKRNIRRADSKIVQVYYNSKLQLITASFSASLVHSGKFEGESLRVEASSGAQVEVELQVLDLVVEASSGASISLLGETKEARVEASSGALIKAENCIAEVLRAEASSGANVSVFATEEANASASSGAIIKVSGAPKTLNKSQSSGGSVKRVELTL